MKNQNSFKNVSLFLVLAIWIGLTATTGEQSRVEETGKGTIGHSV